jgi:hypothetical protein
MKTISLLFLTIIFLAGCKKIDITNGEVPNEYLDRAKKLEGVYRGSFEGRTGELKITFEGNQPQLFIQDFQGNNIVLPQCKSSINNLKWAEVTRKGEVEQVAFYFDPGHCHLIQGRELYLVFNKSLNSIRVAVLDNKRYDTICQTNPGYPGGPSHNCQEVIHEDFLKGSFYR